MMSQKSKRTPTQLTLIDYLLRGQSFAFTTTGSARDCTRRLSALVCYPTMTHGIGRTTQFKRIDAQTYRFDIRTRRYLGRGTYALSARAQGIISQDVATGQTSVQGRVRQGAFYWLALWGMSAWSLTSYALVGVTILFLPLSLLMSVIVLLHWYSVLDDRDALVQAMQAHLNAATDEAPLTVPVRNEAPSL